MKRAILAAGLAVAAVFAQEAAAKTGASMPATIVLLGKPKVH